MIPHGPAQFQDKLSGIQARLMVALCVVGGEDGLAYMVWWAARRRGGRHDAHHPHTNLHCP